MKTHLILILLFAALVGLAQTKFDSAVNTKSTFTDYSGTYQFGPLQNGRQGKLTILHNKSGKILFYIYLDGGKPSEHEGELYGECMLKHNKSIFITQIEDAEKSCSWSMIFSGNTITIKTINDLNECGFGYGVKADGLYRKVSTNRPEYFIDMNNEKNYFHKTIPKNKI